ncbi:MAG: LysR family transcriptional regulator, glycine cleavage system transcriptional activator [Acetobacteraceae bacterium]|jgi:LysR family transcriptional regulator, glycine cleavage system transcriptional activator|nr:LysR family transcriptional regulator, glycine cleavage system transcriptional activator [Acetobacteraceae bacterium]
MNDRHQHNTPSPTPLKAGAPSGRGRLPLLNLFRAFEAAARHRSFRNAADELCITPSAISQQIHRLELSLGVKLFRRLPRRIELTQQGAALANSVQEALVMLQTACDRITQRQDGNTICVDSAPGLGSSWLVSRLPDFRAQHPDVTIILQASNEDVDFARQDVDVAVRWGNGRWPGARATRLVRDSVSPVCSPEFRERYQLRGLQDLPALRNVTQLHVTAQGNTWTDWLAAAGHGSITFHDVHYFSDATLMLQAAMHGQGICLSSYLLAEHDLLSNRLVRPFHVELDLTDGYYVLTNRRSQDREAVAWFREWVCEQARRSVSLRSR